MMTLVKRGPAILLARNIAVPAGGRMSALAGFVEPGESVEDAVHRITPRDESAPLACRHDRAQVVLLDAVPDADAVGAGPRVDRQDLPLVMEATSNGGLKFLYLDARNPLGHYLEYVWSAPRPEATT